MRLMTCAAAAALLCGSTASQARSTPPMVTIQGQVSAGVEHGCLLMHPAGGAVYNVTAATPKPRVGQHGLVTGVISHGPSYCMQGIVLKPAYWRRMR